MCVWVGERFLSIAPRLGVLGSEMFAGLCGGAVSRPPGLPTSRGLLIPADVRSSWSMGVYVGEVVRAVP